MKEWMHARAKVRCGSCRAEIDEGVPLLLIANDDHRLVRCKACARRLFDEDPPTVFPSVPSSPARQPSFTTPHEALSVLRADFRRRQVGESD